MDKFEFESFSQFRDVVEELQGCFIDGDAYSRTPAIEEWRRASRLVRRLSLMCFELLGYATACRQYQVISIRERLHVESCEGGEPKEEKEEVIGPDNTIQFTEKEISKMSITFKKAFIANGLVAHVRKIKSGKRTFCYDIRYRANGYQITASSTDLRKAKEKFLFKTSAGEIEKYKICKVKLNKVETLEDIFDEWYMVKQGTITDKALKRFDVDFATFLPEELRKTAIGKVRACDVDKILKNVAPRKYEELRTLFNGIFKYAIANGIIAHNPVSMIPFKRAERQNREAFSEGEILKLLRDIRQPKYDRIRQATYLLYFFGLRPCEIDEETRREGDFLITRNRKRKNGKIEYKKIPIPKQALRLIEWDKPLTFGVTAKVYYEWYRELLGDKQPYSLRHTFATICSQYVRPDIVEVWLGDSPQRLVGKVYTHFPDDFMRKQMELVVFPTEK